MSTLAGETVPEQPLSPPLTPEEAQEIKGRATERYNQLLAGMPNRPRNDHPTNGPTVLFLAILYIEHFHAQSAIEIEPALYRPALRPLCLRLAQGINQLRTIDLSLKDADSHAIVDDDNPVLDIGSIAAIFEALKLCRYLEELRTFNLLDSYTPEDSVHENYLRLFAEVIEHCPRLQKIDFSNSQLGKMDLHSIFSFCEALKKCPELRELIMGQGRWDQVSVLSPDRLAILFDTFPQCLELEKLDVSFLELTSIDTDSFDRFCRMLPQCLKLRSLNLSGNSLKRLIEDQVGAFFAALQQCCFLEELFLNRTEISALHPGPFQIVCVGLPKLPHLKTLDLGFIKYDQMPEAQVRDLFFALRLCAGLEELSLSHLGTLNPECFNIACDTLVQCQNLRRITLIESRIEGVENFIVGASADTERIQRLCIALSACNNLRELFLEGFSLGRLTPGNFEIVCTMLPRCGQGHLHSLGLKNNLLGMLNAAGFAALSKALVACPELKFLSLYGNLLFAVGPVPVAPVPDFFAILCDALEKCEALKILELGYNFLGNIDVTHFHMLCQTFIRLQALDLSCNLIGTRGPEKIQILCDFFRSCEDLQKLDLSNNILVAAFKKYLDPMDLDPPIVDLGPVSIQMLENTLRGSKSLKDLELKFTGLDHFASFPGTFNPKPLRFLAAQAVNKQSLPALESAKRPALGK